MLGMSALRRFGGSRANTNVSEDEVMLTLDRTEPAVVSVRIDSRGQHTIFWSHDLRELDSPGGAREQWARAKRDVLAGKLDDAAAAASSSSSEHDEGLLAGSCNLYTYPTVKTAHDPRGGRPSAAGLRILRNLIISLYMQTALLDRQDEVGAMPVHALAVCNSAESIALVLELYRRRPELMALTHVRHRAGIPLFVGETALHIFAVNEREVEFVQMVNLALKELGSSKARELFRSAAEGHFFRAKPMLFFGGTALAYAVAFELKNAVIALLATGLLDVNDKEAACPISGFLPIHVAVACGSCPMYDLLTSELPHHQRASEGMLTCRGKRTEFLGLSCLQLAATIGDEEALQHVLRKQCEVRWVWGPVVEYSLDLDGIDSAGRGGGDIMELIVRAGANGPTTSMLLDTFMNGFLHRLFLQKWALYGRRLFVIRRALDMALLALTLVLAFDLKSAPTVQSGHTVLVISMLATMLTIEAFESITAYLFISNEHDTSEERLSTSKQLVKLVPWARMHGIFLLAAAHICTLVACLMILCVDFPTNDAINAADTSGGLGYGSGNQAGNATATAAARRVLRAAAGGGSGGMPSSYANVGFIHPVVDEGAWFGLWIALAFALLLQMFYFIETASAGIESLHVLILAMRRIFLQDIITFMLLYFWQLATAFAVLYILYPRSGERTLRLFSFNERWRAAISLMELGLTGDSLAIDSSQLVFGVWDEMAPMQQLAIALFGGLYIFFVLLSVILLLNMLIALLTHTFEKVLAESKLFSRLSFARRVIRLELLASQLGMRTRVGERIHIAGVERYVYVFRAMVHRQRMVGEDEEDAPAHLASRMGVNFMDVGAAIDPFKEPSPTQLSRVEQMVADQGKVERANKLLLRTLARQSAKPRASAGDGSTGAVVEDLSGSGVLP